MKKIDKELTTTFQFSDDILGKVRSVYDEHPLDSKNWLPPANPKQVAKLYPAQTKAAKDIAYKLFIENKRAILLRASVGVGKTYMYLQVERWMIDKGFFKNCISPWPSLIITKASIVEQTRRVGVNEFGVDGIRELSVLNYDALRSTKGLETILEVRYQVTGGERHEVFKFRPFLRPRFFIIDESQSAKNEDSKQAKITGPALSEVTEEDGPTKIIFSSATPFTRVSEAKYFCINAGIPYDKTRGSQLLVNTENWPNFARRIASPSAPDEHCEAAIERLMEYIAPWVVDVKNIRPQFKAINKILMIDFETPADKAYYDRAFERYLTEVNKIKSQGEGEGSNFAILVEWLKFRQAAEFVRRRWIARNMYHAVQEGYAAGCACNFKATIAGVVVELHKTYKVPRSLISLVWGGDSIYTTNPEEMYSDEEIQQVLATIMRGEVVKPAVMAKIKKQLQAQNAGLSNIPAGLNLGPQNFKERQVEIDRYQRGESLYSLYSFKSGGIGLSLHHSDQLTKEKCRRKPNGYVEVEDIQKIPTRPRRSFLAPTYSAIELVQGLGRYPRIASLSDTIQTLVFYKGTIEQQVAYTVSRKLKCLSKVVRQREDWVDVIMTTSADKLKTIVVPDEEAIDGNELFELDIADEDDQDEE